MPQELALKLEYFTFYLALPFFVLYMHYLFPQEISKKAAISYFLTGSAFSLHVLLTPSRVYSYYLIIFQVITVGFLFYLLYSIIKAIIRKREGSFLVIVGFGVFFATAVNDILYYNEKSLMSDLAPLGVFIFIFVQSYILSSRFSRAFDTVEEMSNKLVEADKLKDEFLATVSHELLTPLNGMIGIAESTLQGSAGKLNQQQENNLNLIIYSGRRLSRLVDDLLDFSRIKNNDIVLNIEPVDLGQTVQRVLTLSRSLRSNKRLTLKSEIPEGLIVEADGNRLEQILYNLIGNAIKYTPSGSITVSASVKEKMAEISVKDTGIGIPEEYHDRIFELYERVENENSGNTNGIGIGLSITKKLVELQGGNIRIKSEAGQGTEVTFTLPVSVKKNKAKTRIKHDSSLETLPHPVSLFTHQKPDLEDSFWILLVDDEPVNIEVVASQLSLEHYNVVTADNGKDAFRKIEESQRFDLVILDIMLPDISGYEVCRLIRERYSLLELPVLMLTARNRPDDVLLAFESGANDYLSKPFDRNEMLARVRTLITLKKVMKQMVATELNFLQAQIKPHFIYNTLNTVMAFCRTAPEKAAELLDELGNYLRGKFNFSSTDQLLPLERELDLVKSYLAIEKARFNERLSVIYSVDEDIKIDIPPLILQPIVENAVKHGIQPKRKGGRIEISIRKTPSDVLIEIKDDGVGMTREEVDRILSRTNREAGIGLQNVNKRLINHFGHGLTVLSEVDKGTVVTIKIPH